MEALVASESVRNQEAASASQPGTVPEWGDRVIVPLDGSPEAAEALPLAKAVASLLGATVHIVHVSETALPPTDMARQLSLDPDELQGVVIDRVIGKPAEVIVALQQDNRLSPIVVSARGRGTPPEQPIGPVATHLIESSRGPVLLVWPEHPPRPTQAVGLWRRILLPLDGTPSTSFAIAPAIDLAQRCRAELYILYVAALGKQRPPEAGTLTPPKYLDQPQYEWPDWAAELLQRLWQVTGLTPSKIPVRMSMASGEPIQEIARFAVQHQIDLIAFAWNGRFIRGGPLAVTSGLREAGCPSLILHAPSRAAAGAEKPSQAKGRERRRAA